MTTSDTSDLRILPGQWRPHDPFEQIAWVSLAWERSEYIWLDFPEAVFLDGDLVYLSHVSKAFPCVYEDLSAVPWRAVEGGLSFERELPNGLRFAGRLTRAGGAAVAMELTFLNGGAAPMRNIRLQTCAYVRPIRELADFAHENVFVHTAADGWTAMNRAMENPADDGTIRLGWREGPRACDWPVIACASTVAARGVAMTWFDHTYSLVGNPDHPCFHADPFVRDLAPGQSDTLRGVLLFYEGDVSDLDFPADFAPYAP